MTKPVDTKSPVLMRSSPRSMTIRVLWMPFWVHSLLILSERMSLLGKRNSNSCLWLLMNGWLVKEIGNIWRIFLEQSKFSNNCPLKPLNSILSTNSGMKLCKKRIRIPWSLIIVKVKNCFRNWKSTIELWMIFRFACSFIWRLNVKLSPDSILCRMMNFWRFSLKLKIPLWSNRI